MARDTADFAQQSSERAMQAANFGMTWGREFAEESFNQSGQAVDGFLRVARKMAEDFETEAIATREQMTSLTHKTLSTRWSSARNWRTPRNRRNSRNARVSSWRGRRR